MRKRLLNNKLPGNTTDFVFSLSPSKQIDAPEWENNDEFSFQGEMYDVISKTILDGNVEIRCISDKAETHLLEYYKDISHQDFDNNSNKKSGLLIKLITSLYTAEGEKMTTIHFDKQLTPFQFLVKKLPGLYSEIPKPPPQLV